MRHSLYDIAAVPFALEDADMRLRRELLAR